jgi:uncharacterized membrane protein
VWLLAAAVLERTYWLRLEPVAAVITLVGLVTAVRGRPRLSGVALAAGAIVKVWPAFLVPFALLVTTGARRVRWIVAFAAPWVAYAVALVVQRPKHGLDWLTFTFSRPIQIESYSGLPAMVAMAFGSHDWKISYVRGMNSAFILSGPHLKGLHAGLELLGLLALALLARRVWMAHRATLLHGTSESTAERTADGRHVLGFPLEQALLVQLIVVLVLIVAGPVFSPQYMVWLAPVFALAAGEGVLRRETAVYIACCALTALVYPLFYDLLIRADPSSVTVLVARDIAVLALLGFAWQRLWRLTAASSAAAPAVDPAGPAVTTEA